MPSTMPNAHPCKFLMSNLLPSHPLRSLAPSNTRVTPTSNLFQDLDGLEKALWCRSHCMQAPTPCIRLLQAVQSSPCWQHKYLAGHLDNLANAATQEKSTFAQLADNNASLTKSFKAPVPAYATFVGRLALAAAATPLPVGTCAACPVNYVTKVYSRSYVFKVGKAHTSITCNLARAITPKPTTAGCHPKMHF